MKNVTKTLLILLIVLLSTANLLTAIFLNTTSQDQLFKIVNASILVIISILLSVMIAKTKTINVKYTLLSLILLVFITFNFLVNSSLYSFPTKTVVENFSQKHLETALEYAKKNNIKLDILYEYSDNIEEYFVISQNVEPGTVSKGIKEIKLIVSQGPDLEKNIIVPNMLGWDTKKVLEFVNKNYLVNVSVDFVKSEEKQNTVISQNTNGEIKRNANLTLAFSKGTEDLTEPVALEDFTNKTIFEATLWLKMNGISQKVEYAFNDDYKDTLNIVDKNGKKINILNFKKGNILTQDKKSGDMVTPNQDVVTLFASKGKKIIIPDLLNMSIDDVTKFVIENKLKIKYLDNYDDTVELGKVISASHKNGDIIEEGTLITITSSKGQLKMEDFKSVAEFKEWAAKYNIPIQEISESNNDIAEGQIIKFSHQANQIIKNGETVTVYISKGAPVAVPNFKSKTRGQIISECKGLGLLPKFTYSGFSQVARDTALSQSVAAGTKVDRGTGITITLSKGPGVTIPSLIGMHRNDISAKCNGLGIRVSFVQGGYSSTPADHAVSQSLRAGSVTDNGISITVTLSKGPAQSRQVSIQNNWLVAGNASASGSSIKSNLEAALPGCKVNIVYVPTNGNNIGLPASGNVVTLTQGQTTTISIYK